MPNLGKLGVPAVLPVKFSVEELTDGHRKMIAFTRDRHDDDDILFALGHNGFSSPRSTKYHLRVEEREAMIRQTYPGVPFKIMPLEDNPISEAFWSQDLDDLVVQVFGARQAILYGGRDSFYAKYTTKKYNFCEVPETPNVSGTAQRKELVLPLTRDARAALIHDQDHRHPFVYATSDLAIYDRRSGAVLCGLKKKFRGFVTFIGGHVEKRDGNLIVTCRREGGEELAGIEFGALEYIASEVIDDPRYRDTKDAVATTFYKAPYIGGVTTGSDDIDDGVEWVMPEDLERRLVPWHRKLGRAYVETLARAAA